MPGLPVLDVVIGLVFLYFVISIICTTASVPRRSAGAEEEQKKK